MTSVDHEKGIIGITLMAENKFLSASMKTSSMLPKETGEVERASLSLFHPPCGFTTQKDGIRARVGESTSLPITNYLWWRRLYLHINGESKSFPEDFRSVSARE